MLEKRPAFGRSTCPRILPLADKAMPSRWTARVSSPPKTSRPSVTLCARPPPPARGVGHDPTEGKLNKPEREIESFPRTASRLAQSQGSRKHAGALQHRRALAGAQRRGHASPPKHRVTAGAVRVPHTLQPGPAGGPNDAIRLAIDAREFAPSLLYGVTGSGKTEILPQCHSNRGGPGTRRAAAGAGDRGLTPAMAGQFFSRFATVSLISAQRVHTTSNAPTSGAASAPARPRWWWATRSGVFAPVRISG